ncbi:DUF4625 domain-containing protein [Niabella insulamsoli]|uniref:DUF4625 domain-containing protein n=1 Tax=Niabella insulamsoli TaxID=3144874 RepID=UPI0031FE1E57
MIYKKKLKMLLITASVGVFFAGCSKRDTALADTGYPDIDVTSEQAFPKQCSQFSRGAKAVVKAVVSDNVELGSVSFDIHHNFDHHTHSTEVNDCGLDPKKTPVNPMLLIKSMPIPPGSKTYVAVQEIEIPSAIDPGDYHFLIRVTDKEGWQTLKGLSIKIR